MEEKSERYLWVKICFKRGVNLVVKSWWKSLGGKYWEKFGGEVGGETTNFTFSNIFGIFGERRGTALSLNAEAFTNNRTFQAVEPEKFTRKYHKNNSCAFLRAGAYI